VLEPAYEEIRKRDNMSWNILSLTFRASLLGFKWGDMAQALSGAGMNSQALVQFEQRMEAFNRLLSNQSLAILPADGGLESVNYTFSGLSDVYQQFQLDIAGAAGYPVSRLFGRTITGLGQSNDADERLYEERVAMEQEEIRPQLEKLYSVLCMSELGEIPDDLNLAFPSIRVLNDSEKADIAGKNAATIVSLVNAGILNKPQAIKEVKQGSDVTGLGTNLTDEDIEAAERDEDLGLEPQMEGETGKDEPVAAKATDEWAESKHPRERSGENAGQFTSGGGSGGGSVSLESAPSDRGEWPDHIKKLKLPPAWKDVKINANPDADLLAIGKDKAGRPQYVYSKRFQNSQSESKFARIKELDGKFEKIWDQNQERLRSGDAKQRDHAECSRLIMAMGIRPGSDSDTKAKVKAYGATTLEGRHIVKEDGQVCLRFTGKKGVAINLPVADPEIAKSLLDRAKKAGADGKLFPAVSESSLLDYTHSFDGGGFKTKDFRTLLATRSAAKEVEKSDPPKDEREYKKRVMDVAKSVSGRLGNTPIVALQSYINPAIFAPWRSALATA
jgi:DNA topoisomerase IB